MFPRRQQVLLNYFVKAWKVFITAVPAIYTDIDLVVVVYVIGLFVKIFIYKMLLGH